MTTPPLPVQTTADASVDVATRPAPISHYENFPVASWLCPPHLRPAVAAIYWFARTADDIADEGDAPASQRLADLADYRAALESGSDARWPGVFGPLRAAIARHGLPVPLLADLLSAFAQDVVRTRDGAGYADRAELLDYCSRSANPVGRLLLHLYGVHDAQSLAQSDAICSALQLVNFWQDLSQDIPRGRFYLPAADCAAHAVSQPDLLALRSTPQAARLVESEVRWARDLMCAGAPLAPRLPGRIGWELRLVVQGGLRILDRIERAGYASLAVRPKLGRTDLLVAAWRALWM